MEPVHHVWSLLMPFVAAAGIGYAIYGGQLFLRQRSIVFKPSRAMIGDPVSVGCHFEEVSLRASRHLVHGWWMEGASAHRTFLFLPGSIGNISRDLATLALLRSVGGAVLAIDYPGFGASDGRPSERASERHRCRSLHRDVSVWCLLVVLGNGRQLNRGR